MTLDTRTNKRYFYTNHRNPAGTAEALNAGLRGQRWRRRCGGGRTLASIIFATSSRQLSVVPGGKHVKFRKHTSAGVLLALIVVATGCSTTSKPTAANSGPSGQTGSSGAGKSGNIKIAFVPQITGIPYYAGFAKGAEQAAAKFGGAQFTMTGSSTASSAEQLQIFQSLVQQGYNAISISPLDPTSINSAISAARAKGVVVTTSDADAKNSARQVFVSQADDKALGDVVMDELAKQMGGTGKFGIVSGAPGTASLDSWSHFIQMRASTNYPKIQFVGGVRHATDSAGALKEAQDLMTAFPDIKGIVAVPSTAVPGVSQAVFNAGKKGKVAVIGYGSPKTAGPFIKNGVMKETVLWDVPQLGYLTIWADTQLLQGKSFQPTNTVPGIDHPVTYDAATKTLLLGPPKIFDSSNYAQFDF